MVPLLFFFLAMIGFRLPTVRAVLMGWAVVLAFALERDVDPLSSISAAGLAIVLFSPLQVFQAGFQMSFAAVGALVVLTPIWDRWAQDRGLPGRWLWTSLGVSLAAQAGVAPIVASHFGIWTPAAILSNLVAIPLVWILLALGMGLMGTVLLGGLGSALLAPPILFFSEGLLRVVKCSAKVPWGHFDALPLGPVGIGAWYGILALLVWKPSRAATRQRWPFKRIHAVLILCALWLWSGLVSGAKGRLEITFPSLGQGDCILVEFPKGGCLLVDGGERFDSSQRTPELVRWLLRKGLTRVDAIVNTHPQSDHIGCLPEVLDHFPWAWCIIVAPAGREKRFRRFRRPGSAKAARRFRSGAGRGSRDFRE
jgi:competence protein ComEC